MNHNYVCFVETFVTWFWKTDKHSRVGFMLQNDNARENTLKLCKDVNGQYPIAEIGHGWLVQL